MWGSGTAEFQITVYSLCRRRSVELQVTEYSVCGSGNAELQVTEYSVCRLSLVPYARARRARECRATGPWVKVILVVLLLMCHLGSGPYWDLFLWPRYHQAWSNQLTCEGRWDKASYRVNMSSRWRVLNPARWSLDRAQTSITQSPCMSIMTLSRALWESYVLATRGLHSVIH